MNSKLVQYSGFTQTAKSEIKELSQVQWLVNENDNDGWGSKVWHNYTKSFDVEFTIKHDKHLGYDLEKT